MAANSKIMVGECFVGEGNEIAHIDLIMGPKDGPVGHAFAQAWVSQTHGHTALLALLNLNLAPKPSTVMINKVTIKGGDQATQMFGPAQAAVAKAVADSVAEGVIPKDAAEDWCLVVGVFIHWDAKDNQKIYDYNYEATKGAIKRAINGEPGVEEVLSRRESESHALQGF
jgi:5,6,7,8-tetrahydromethanopterin hydro-lyase